MHIRETHQETFMVSEEALKKAGGKWILNPNFLYSVLGKIDFKTIKFYDCAKGIVSPYTPPEGGGPSKSVKIGFMHGSDDEIIDAYEDEFLPDQWLIDIPGVTIQYKLHEKYNGHCEEIW